MDRNKLSLTYEWVEFPVRIPRSYIYKQIWLQKNVLSKIVFKECF